MQQEHTTAIGIDIGATTTRVGVVASDGKLAAIRSAPTPKGPSADEALIARLLDDFTALRLEVRNLHVSTIGVGVPGLVDSATNTVRRAVNLPFLEGDWLVRELAARSGLPVTLHTDIDAATWAEYRTLAIESRSGIIANAGATAKRSAAVPPRHRTNDERAASDTPRTRFAHLRLGSGIGLGVIIDGQPVSIEPDRTTHARLLVVDERDDAPACPCGLRGCLELYAAGKALVASAKSIGMDAGLPGLEQAIIAGDVPALELLDATAGVIVRAVQNIVQRYALEVIVLGGGVIEHLPALWTRIGASTDQPTPSGADHSPPIERTQLGDDTGVIGVALLSIHQA